MEFTVTIKMEGDAFAWNHHNGGTDVDCMSAAPEVARILRQLADTIGCPPIGGDAMVPANARLLDRNGNSVGFARCD